ncbi:MAG: hypothetical protein Q9171_004483 [Xanthocarpia ochracea]
MLLGEVSLRPRQRISEHLDGADTISHDPSHRIEFKHPAYTDGCNTYLVLAALDHPHGGLHYNTALVACGIIAGNRWDGYFRAARDGPIVSLQEDDLMPHGQLDASLSATLRDGEQCRVLGRKEQCSVAHIVPVEEVDWFHVNKMSRYVLDNQRRSRAAVSDVNNLMLLRADLHTSFDTAKKFVFVPKKPERNRSNMVTHLLSASAEYGPLYHNTLAYSLDSIPRPYLFARFAWAIFPLFTIPRGNPTGTGGPKQRPRQPTAGDEGNLRKACIKRPKFHPTNSSLPDIEPTPEPILEPALSLSKYHALSASTHGTPDVKACDTSIPPSPVAAATEQLGPSLHDDVSSDWDHFCALRERGLENERHISDPGGGWLEEVDWAIDVLKHEHSARDTQAWAYVDEAHRILSEVDESPEWAKNEDRLVPYP